MTYRELIAKGLLEKRAPDPQQVRQLQVRAQKDLRTAQRVFRIDTDWAYAIAYQAMLRAARGLLMARGYRPRGRDPQKTVILAAGIALGEPYQDLLNRLDVMRRKYQRVAEESVYPVPRLEAEMALKDAERFLARVMALIRRWHPELAAFP